MFGLAWPIPKIIIGVGERRLEMSECGDSEFIDALALLGFAEASPFTATEAREVATHLALRRCGEAVEDCLRLRSRVEERISAADKKEWDESSRRFEESLRRLASDADKAVAIEKRTQELLSRESNSNPKWREAVTGDEVALLCESVGSALAWFKHVGADYSFACPPCGDEPALTTWRAQAVPRSNSAP